METDFIHTNAEDFDLKRIGDNNQFTYRWLEDNSEVDNETLREEIKQLVIPPMWKNVLICSNDCGHIRATGYDEKGRKQYVYNPKWMEFRNAEKFSKMKEFAKMLPTIRKHANSDLNRKKWTKKKSLALCVLVLDETHIRIGNSQYEEKNGTYGLTTLRRKHLEIEEGGIEFYYKAKSNKYRKVVVKDGELSKLIKESSDLPGYEIFRYREGGKFHDLSSSDVNEYLQEVANGNYSAKDFRTWGGSVFAVKYLDEAKRKLAANKRLKLSSTLVKLVAQKLGNTPAICREYYIHPTILNKLEDEHLEQFDYPKKETPNYSLSSAEQATLELIKS